MPLAKASFTLQSKGVEIYLQHPPSRQFFFLLTVVNLKLDRIGQELEPNHSTTELHALSRRVSLPVQSKGVDCFNMGTKMFEDINHLSLMQMSEWRRKSYNFSIWFWKNKNKRVSGSNKSLTLEIHLNILYQFIFDELTCNSDEECILLIIKISQTYFVGLQKQHRRCR